MEVNNIWTKSLLPTPIDYLIIIAYLLIIFIISRHIKAKYIKEKPEYKYFVKGLFIKILGGIIFCLIYIVYYQEAGDTIGYFRSSEALFNLFFKDPYAYFSIMYGNLSAHNSSTFDIYTGFPWYYSDNQAFAVVRFINPFLILSFKNYFTATILLSAFSYIGIWKMYQMFCELYPKYNKYFAITVLFIPSVLFWGSGILKDTFTLSASCWFTYNFYKVFIKKNDRITNVIFLILNIFIILSLKPYIIVALFPGTIIWGLYDKITQIKSKVFRLLIAPFLILFAFIIGYAAISLFKEELGKYSNMESIIKKAKITQQDLIRAEQYGINYYNIGEFKTTADIIKKTPNAIVAGLYRPFIWEGNTLFIFISGIENAIILLFTIYIFVFSGGFLRNSKNIFQDPLLIFLFLYAVFFAFSIGLSTANFGALVRYRIPLLPFFTSGLMILYIKKLSPKL
ncbi:MAG: hypothetical protein AUJ97_02625 [Bacteroidetes bacterium CG2_30_32_10]|nr:MAG: hypothetical protein AUJ97_02625 [Bacteroidetes bacterium CG2_30_32_10]